MQGSTESSATVLSVKFLKLTLKLKQSVLFSPENIHIIVHQI
jgi:hypothetical protein